MRNLLGSLLAIAVAGVAAIAATTALLNTPLRIGPATTSSESPNTSPQTQAPGADPASRPTTTDPAKAPTAGGTPEPAGSAGSSAAGAPATDAAKDKDKDKTEVDQDPYEGILPEELPPDLQYNADSSVSFPTNI